MWSVVNRVGQLLGLSRPEPQVNWDEVAAVLDAEDETYVYDLDDDSGEVNDNDGDQVACQHRTGVVTELYQTHGYITSATSEGEGENRPLYFQLKNAPENLKVGNRVVFLAFRLTDDTDWVVRKVLYVDNEHWDAGEEADEEDDTEQPIVKEKCETDYRHVISKVTGRDGRTVFAGNVQFSLDSVDIEFIPVEGDWVSMSSLVQLQSEGDTVLMVDRVSPLRSCTREGRVSHWTPDCQLGIVDGEVMFSKDACEPGYLPRVGDQVTVYCIESEQGQLTWRAVQIVASSDKKIESSDDLKLAPLLQNKQGIIISENTNYGIVSLDKEKQIKIDISNEGDSPQTLVAIEKSNQESQFLLPSLPFTLPVTLQPHGSLQVIAKVKGRFVGRSSELLRFRFEGFEIGRQLTVDVQNSSLTTCLAESRNRGAKRDKQEPITARKLLATRNGFIVPGVRPIKPANFVPVHLGMFTIPEKLMKLVLGSEQAVVRKREVIGQLLQEFRYLAEPLSGENYVARWDTIIHVEELEHMANISRYNTTAGLHRVDEFLSLEIPGLAERRPSLMVNDHVIARPSWSNENSWATDSNSVGYEGFIHKVLSNEVLLKFNPSFHDSCSGVYSITFQANRTSFRRLHQAVHVGHKNLTSDWLFPTRVTYQPPQVVIVGEENHKNPIIKPKNMSNNAVEDSGDKHENISDISKTLKIDCDSNISNCEKDAQEFVKEETINSKNGDDVSVNDAFITSEKNLTDDLNSSADSVNNVNSCKSNRSKTKRQKSKVSDMFEKLPLKDNTCQKVSPPRASVVGRFLQSGNCNSSEKNPKEVENVFRLFMNLPCATPTKNTEMKTLEEIEKSLLSPCNDVVEDIKPLPIVEDYGVVDSGNKSKSSNKKQKSNKESQLNHSKNVEKDENTKNFINKPSRQNKHDKIQWNSNSEMKLGIEKEAYFNTPRWKRTKIRWFNPLLNHYQKEAVRNILKGEARPLPYVIFGPPGTGKTITVVEAVLQIYFLVPESRLMIATPSNSAADLVCERLLDCGLLAAGDLLRLCSFNYADQGRMPDRLRPYCGTADIKARDDKGATAPSHVQEGVVSISRHAIGRHRVTVGTCGSLAVLYQMGFPKGHFTHVFVDEAGQATEPEILIPLVFLHKSYGQAILAGDPLQLGPVILSSVAEEFGLGESFLSRLLQRSLYCRDIVGYPSTSGYNPHLVTRLLYNYRSLPEILDLPNSLFYNGDLIPKVSDVSSDEAEVLERLRSLLPARQSPPSLVFHGIRGTNCQTAESPSWYNPHEAVQATLYLQSLYNAGLTPDQCGIITPYQAQVLKIRSLLDTLEVDAPKVGSVEEFQGQERMVIILSTVRSSPRLVETDLRHSVGFVASPRRLNVAITRARACLVVLGNPHLLSRDQYWRSVLQYCVSRGGYRGCDLPPDL